VEPSWKVYEMGKTAEKGKRWERGDWNGYFLKVEGSLGGRRRKKSGKQSKEIVRHYSEKKRREEFIKMLGKVVLPGSHGPWGDLFLGTRGGGVGTGKEKKTNNEKLRWGFRVSILHQGDGGAK